MGAPPPRYRSRALPEETSASAAVAEISRRSWNRTAAKPTPMGVDGSPAGAYTEVISKGGRNDFTVSSRVACRSNPPAAARLSCSPRRRPQPGGARVQVARSAQVARPDRRRRHQPGGARRRPGKARAVRGHEPVQTGQLQPPALSSERPLHHRDQGHLVGRHRQQVRSEPHGADAHRLVRDPLRQASALGRRQGRGSLADHRGRRTRDFDARRGGEVGADGPAHDDRLPPVRRVVTGHGANQVAKILIDGVATNRRTSKSGGMSTLIWCTDRTPADISVGENAEDMGARVLGTPPPPNGTWFTVNDIPAGRRGPMQRTEPIDYVIVLAGELEMQMDDSTVKLKAGDVLVQRGTNHAWINRGAEPARVAFILVDAKPLGIGHPVTGGATVR